MVRPVRQVQDQSRPSGESSAEPTFQEAALARLSAEREESESDQPPGNDDVDERETDEETRSSADQLDDDSDELDQESDDDDEYADDDQPESDPDAPRVFKVDGVDYTSENIKELVEARSKYDTEFRRRTQITARLKQEYKAAGNDVGYMSNFFLNLANANLNQYTSYDASKLSGEQLKTFQSGQVQATQGRDRLLQQIGTMKEAVEKKQKEFDDAQAEESRTVLKGIEPRWNDEFYTGVREFAVESGRYSAEEFEDVTDWRVIEGMVALMDRDATRTKRTEVNREPKRPRRRRQRTRRSRNTSEQFQTLTDAVHKSPNAKQDGSFRAMKQAQLARERGDI